MKKNVLLSLIICFLSSCKYNVMNTINHLSFDKLVADSNQLIINLVDSTKTLKTYNVTNEQITYFKNTLQKAEKTDYCCCPEKNYTISFLEDKKELDMFYVDTVEFKDKIRIYEASYQYSYIIEKQKWKYFLNKLDN